MKKIIQTLLFLIPLNVIAAGNSFPLTSVNIDLSDNASLQRGAKHYVSYCLGCHSTKYMRYKRIAIDLDIDENTVLNEIAPEGANIYDQMHTAMDKRDSKKWFGTTPPDLSLIARIRGKDWLYSYLKGFYTDKSKPFGVNNIIFKDVGMPNMLWKLQGTQTPLIETVNGEERVVALKRGEQGSISSREFDTVVKDLVNFLVYVGEPIQLERQRMGKYVLFYLLIFTIIAYLLKKEYWKDIN